ncbi:hypothetical protein Tco_1144108 [Tanacetum coccineum]
MTQAQQRQYMATYLKNQGGWKLTQIKKLTDEEHKEKFEYLMRSMERFVPMDTEKESRKRIGVELQTESSKTESAKSGTEEDVKAYIEERADEPSSEEFPMRLFSPLNLDLSYSGLEEFQQPEFEGYGPNPSKSVSEDTSNEFKESPDAPLFKELVSDDKLEKKTIFPIVAKIEFVRPKQQEKPVSILNLREELVKWDNSMGYNMEGLPKWLKEIMGQGDYVFKNKVKVSGDSRTKWKKWIFSYAKYVGAIWHLIMFIAIQMVTREVFLWCIWCHTIRFSFSSDETKIISTPADRRPIIHFSSSRLRAVHCRCAALKSALIDNAPQSRAVTPDVLHEPTPRRALPRPPRATTLQRTPGCRYKISEAAHLSAIVGHDGQHSL